jgi:hypothetical protein
LNGKPGDGMTAKGCEAARGISVPWSAGAVDFDEATKV